MTPNPVTFFLSPPRCRTAWLSAYLTGMGVYCFHELWRTATTPTAFAEAIWAKRQHGPVANADPSNWFFVDDLQRLFPDAQFIELHRNPKDVYASLQRSYGEGPYESLLEAYERARQIHLVTKRGTYLMDWWNAETSKEIWWTASGGLLPFNEDWHQRCHEWNIQLTNERIARDWQAAELGAYAHLTERLSSYLGGMRWVQ